MKKFVIEYATGEYDSYSEHIYTMEAELKADIQLWILAAIEEWKLVSAEHRKLNNDPLRQTDFLKWHENYQEFVKNNNVWLLDVNGYLIKIPDPEDLKQNELDIFTITELNQWFENNKPIMSSMKNE